MAYRHVSADPGSCGEGYRRPIHVKSAVVGRFDGLDPFGVLVAELGRGAQLQVSAPRPIAPRNTVRRLMVSALINRLACPKQRPANQRPVFVVRDLLFNWFAGI
jgi:hypothetical protein